MSTTSEDEQGRATEQLVDDVLEALDRSLTKLRRRTRDVIQLGREREDLIATINNGGVAVVSDAVATVDDEASTAIHGESEATDIADETPVEPEATDTVDETPVEPVASEVVDETPAEPEAPEVVDEASGFDPGDIAPLAEPSSSPSWVADNEVQGTADEVNTPESIADADARVAEAAPEPTHVEVSEAAVVHEAAAQDGSGAWETPDLEWTDNSTVDPDAGTRQDVAPHEFPHPSPPIDADAVTPLADVDVEYEIVDEGVVAVRGTSEVSAETDVRGAEADSQTDSPFAAEFEEHVEDLGGALPPSPFDLDAPPEPSSYRPRSFQGGEDAEFEADSAAGIADDRPAVAQETPADVSSAWDDFAATPEETPAPATTGSRLRDLVNQARDAERVRAADGGSDFDLIKNEPAVSRYNKNSAKLPRVGISSEEISSSVANLRKSLTSGDKKSSGDRKSSRDRRSSPPDREDDPTPLRTNRRAEKKAAKEAARQAALDAKAEAERQKKQK